MRLSSEQEQGIKAINEWMADPDRWMFYLGGFAGTGKTTMIQEYINGLSQPPLCLAPTGKAATVLQRKLTNATVSTVHSALYKPRQQSLARLSMLQVRLQLAQDESTKNLFKEQIREEKNRLAAEHPTFETNESAAIVPGELVIIDEASMVNDRMMDDLANTEAKVLFVGDPGQLPPVGDTGYFANNKPDHMLSQIQRQALDNPIIRLSMEIRNKNEPTGDIDLPEIQKFHKSRLQSKLTDFDQILASKNEIRRKINRMVRKSLGREGTWPVKGERLICLKNQFKFDTWMVNGMHCQALGDASLDDLRLCMAVDLLYEDSKLASVPFYTYHIEVHYNALADQEPYENRKDLIELDYGYCITVHKSQGSEWNRVLLADDRLMAGDANFRRRWLYTAVTRAKEHLTWITGL